MTNKNIRILVWIALLLSFNQYKAYSQDTTYARQIIYTLCSPEFAGRAYVDNGDKKAAEFIASEFQKDGLKALSENYFQKFEIQINTISELGDLIVFEDTLIPAVDYYISNASKSRSGTYELKFVNDSLFLNNRDYLQAILMTDLSDKFLVFSNSQDDFKYSFKTEVGGLIFLKDDNIGYWDFRHAQQPINYAIVEINKSLLPRDTKTIQIKFRSKYYNNYPTQNVIGYIKGKLYPDSFVAITAHYDHMGKMGKDIYFPGANDNASGTAMMLDLARYFSDSVNQPDYSIVFMSFSGEEVGLLGSQYYVRNPLFKLEKIKMLINLDMVGTGSDGIKVVNGSIFKGEFKKLQTINSKHKYLKAVKVRGESCNSDHCPFYTNGVPSFFIYTLGDEYKEYHTITDKAEDLPLTKYPQLFSLLRDYIIDFNK